VEKASNLAPRSLYVAFILKAGDLVAPAVSAAGQDQKKNRTPKPKLARQIRLIGDFAEGP
jgi:hypothetical protein